MSNVVEFKSRPKTTTEKLTDALGTKKYISFWVTENGAICYNYGDLELNEFAYIEKLLSMLVTDTIHEKTVLT